MLAPPCCNPSHRRLPISPFKRIRDFATFEMNPPAGHWMSLCPDSIELARKAVCLQNQPWVHVRRSAHSLGVGIPEVGGQEWDGHLQTEGQRLVTSSTVQGGKPTSGGKGGVEGSSQKSASHPLGVGRTFSNGMIPNHTEPWPDVNPPPRTSRTVCRPPSHCGSSSYCSRAYSSFLSVAVNPGWAEPPRTGAAAAAGLALGSAVQPSIQDTHPCGSGAGEPCTHPFTQSGAPNSCTPPHTPPKGTTQAGDSLGGGGSL